MTSNDLHFEMRGAVAVIRLSRPSKRNGLGDALVLAHRQVLVHALHTDAVQPIFKPHAT